MCHSWEHFADLGIYELLVIVLLLKRRLTHEAVSSLGEAKQLPLPFESLSCTFECVKQWPIIAQPRVRSQQSCK